MNLPQHILIIPDGNRRWAKKKGLVAFLGHEIGAGKLEEILETALELEIPYFTFWGSSLDNITKRSKEEVEFLFGVFEKYFARLLANKKIEEKKVKVSIFGRWQELFPEKLKEVMNRVVEKTKNYDKYHLTFLMAYSGVDEMTAAINKIAEFKVKSSKSRLRQGFGGQIKVNENLIKQNLWTKDLPAVDLVIRTGGEPHWSAGIMMWDVSDAQLYFTDILWPDFGTEEFRKAMENYSKTERRFGK